MGENFLDKIKNIENFNILELDREGIYFLYDKDNLIYIGESENLIRRIFCNHRNGTSRNSTLIRKLLRGDAEKSFKNERDVKKYIKSLEIKILADASLNDQLYRREIEKFLKDKFNPKL